MAKTLKRQNLSALSDAMEWAERGRQLMLLIQTVTILPSFQLKYAITLSASEFHPYLFKFLTKESARDKYDSLIEMVPFYADKAFRLSMKLWGEVVDMADSSKISEICNNYQNIPEYLISYLTDTKKVPSARLSQPVTFPHHHTANDST